MLLLNHSDSASDSASDAYPFRNGQPRKLSLVRLTRDLFNGRYRAGELVQLSEIEAEYELDRDSVLNILSEFKTLGMVTMSGRFSARVLPAEPERDAGSVRGTGRLGRNQRPKRGAHAESQHCGAAKRVRGNARGRAQAGS